MRRRHRSLRLIVALLLLSLALAAEGGQPHAAHAQLPCGLIQNVSGNQSGTWTSDRVYVLTSSVTVPTGQTLVIEPGTVVKAHPYASLYVNGTLNADGTTAEPIYFTSVKDDDLCGDTNGDGDTNRPTVNDWGFIEFEAGSNDTSSLSRAVLRYGGLGYRLGAGEQANRAIVRLRNATPQLAYLSMQQNHRNAVELEGGDWTTGALNSTSVVYWLGWSLNVAANQTLTIAPGVKIKAPAATSFYVSGKLTANGTPSSPIFFTSEKDDTVCGLGASDELVCDTDNKVDEPTTNNWGFVEFESSSDDTSSLSRTVLRYGGFGYRLGAGEPANRAIVRLRNATPRLDYLSMVQNHRNAVELEGGDWSTGTLNSTSVVYWLGWSLNVATNQTLTIAPGVKIKAPADTSLYVSGKLIANGTEATDVSPVKPIIFTSEKDDTVCGIGASNEQVCDTDNTVDGPAPRDWGFIEFESTSNPTSSISRAILRYGGKGYRYGAGAIGDWGVLRLRGASPTLARNRFQHNYIGVDLEGGAQPTLTCNDFIQNQAFGMRNSQPATLVAARGQWWNSTSGPKNASNPNGAGEVVSDGVDFLEWAQEPCTGGDDGTPPPWLVLLYMAGDNSGPGAVNLAGAMRELLPRLASMPYNPHMRLVVLFDGDERGDTKIYTRLENELRDVTELAAQQWLGGMGGSAGSREIDSGSAISLSNFVNWARAAYPGSPHTMLSLIDHGGGWSATLDPPGQPSGVGRVQAGGWRGMNMDLRAPGGSSLSTRELGQALRNSGHFDVLMLDACLMGMLENAYELRAHADYLVAGANILFADLPYERYLANDGLTAATTPRGLARRLVDTYNAESFSQDAPTAISAIDLAQLRSGVPGNLPAALNLLATKILEALPATPAASDPLVLALTAAYTQTQKFDYDSSLSLDPREGYVDLVDFAQNLRDSADQAITPEIRAAAGDVAAIATTGDSPVIVRTLVRSGDYDGATWDLSRANGLSIFLPLGEQDYRPTRIDPANPTQPAQPERQLRYYADPNQLMLSRDVPQWAALLLRLEPTVPVIRAGPGDLPQGIAALALAEGAAPLATPIIDRRAFTTPGQQGAETTTYSISGRVLVGGQPLGGVLINLGGGRTITTGAGGTYTIGGLPAGTYTLTPSLAGYTFSPGSLTVTLPPGAVERNFVATEDAPKIYLPLLRR